MILVTGGAGYIGSHVIRELLRQGRQPIVYDNLQAGHERAVKGAVFIEGDLADRKKVKETLRSYPIDTVMHFAADCLVGESVKNPLKYFNNNVRNSLQLLELLVENNIKKFVFSSSAAVYGEPEEIPITEKHPCAPTNPYGETKWIFEKVLQKFQDLGKMKYVALRYFNAAGADSEGDLGEDHSPETHLIPLVIKAAQGGGSVSIYGIDYDTPDGTCIRDYIHVTDIAQAHILALNKLERGEDSGVYNLGNGNGYSVREVIEATRKVTGKKIVSIESPRRPGDPSRLVASSEKISKEFGWVPKYPELEAIVETAWRWHRNHPNGYGT
ncbi:MAG: UDP-glucose 4-epimerase GalE [Thermodesulfobacteriota bacterium]